MDEHFGTIIVGGGQAGLAMGHELQRKGLPFVILDAAEQTGDAWRTRWDSLRLFTPARFSALPGMRFTGQNKLAPTKDEMADYLAAYAERFELPIRHGVRVDGLTREGGRFLVTAGVDRYTADHVVVATGAFHTPWTPAFAAELDPRIVQLHSRDYRNPSQLRPGGVLLVGAGNSGCDIALDVASNHPTWLAGRHPGHVPFRIEGRVTHHLVRVVRFVGHHVLTWRTPIGRKVLPKLMQGGNPVVRIKPKDIAAAGVESVPRVAGVRDGLPVLEDDRVLNVANVIWCTGYRTSFSWIDLPVFAPDGVPLHERGVVQAAPGLYFVGLDFQFAATSETITGVGRDVAYVARSMKRHPVAPVAGGSLVAANAGDGDDGQPRTGT
jgi:putative flavoprotein involved in K+ transport